MMVSVQTVTRTSNITVVAKTCESRRSQLTWPLMPSFLWTEERGETEEHQKLRD